MPQLHKATAEFLGVFALVFFGCGSIMLIERFPGALPPAAIAPMFGASIMVMVYALGHISGAHFNPAVTLAFSLARHFPKKEVPIYWLAQFAGGLAAICLLKYLLPAGLIYGATLPTIALGKAFCLEFVLTFFLMFVIISVATDTRAEGTMAGIAIGTTVMIAGFIGGPLTGASMNPARSLAPALFENGIGVLWIYLIGPCLGAIAAAFVYEWIRCNPSNQSKTAKGCC